MKLPEDRVGPFQRYEIDRDIGPYSDFKDRSGNPLVKTALADLKRQGRLAVLDGGCGTGRALWDLRSQLLWRSRRSRPEDLRMLGVNNIDYSAESELAEVRQAFVRREMEYLVADLENVDLSGRKFDYILLFEVLIHNSPGKVARIWSNLLPALADRGRLHGNLHSAQLADPVIADFLANLNAAGYQYFRRDVRFRGDSRAFLLIEKLGSPNRNR
jgi:SAM-dependent methyltransferase